MVLQTKNNIIFIQLGSFVNSVAVA